MDKQPIKGIEAIAVRRAVLADADKVRYRVYRSAEDYIAVIAESALMAAKVSGISKPYRIVRDLPTESVAMRAGQIADYDATAERVSLAITPRLHNDSLRVMPEPGPDAPFVPLQLRDLERTGTRRLRILSPDQLMTEPAADSAASMAVQPPPPDTKLPEREEIVAEPVDGDTLSPEEVAKLLG